MDKNTNEWSLSPYDPPGLSTSSFDVAKDTWPLIEAAFLVEGSDDLDLDVKSNHGRKHKLMVLIAKAIAANAGTSFKVSNATVLRWFILSKDEKIFRISPFVC
jgi:hypothetical protein